MSSGHGNSLLQSDALAVRADVVRIRADGAVVRGPVAVVVLAVALLGARREERIAVERAVLALGDALSADALLPVSHATPAPEHWMPVTLVRRSVKSLLGLFWSPPGEVILAGEDLALVDEQVNPERSAVEIRVVLALQVTTYPSPAEARAMVAQQSPFRAVPPWTWDSGVTRKSDVASQVVQLA